MHARPGRRMRRSERRPPAMIGLVDYGMGNRRSVEKALEHVGARVLVSSDPAALRGARGLVVPGVGAFPDGDGAAARARPRRASCVERAAAGVPLLGICLGMHLAFERSSELGGAEGLGLVPGEVRELAAGGLKLPQIGWNEVRWERRRAAPRGPARAPRLLPRAQLRRRPRRPGRRARHAPSTASASPRSSRTGRSSASSSTPRSPPTTGSRCSPTGSRASVPRDPLPGDRHPRRPRRAPRAGRLRPGHASTPPTRSRPRAPGPPRAPRGCTSSTSTAPAPARPVNLDARRADRRRRPACRSSSAAACAAPRRSPTRSPPAPSASCSAPRRSPTRAARGARSPSTASGSSSRSTCAAAWSRPPAGRRPASLDAVSAVAALVARGVRRFVYTDVDRDGMLGGIDGAAVARVADARRGRAALLGRDRLARRPRGARRAAPPAPGRRDRRQGALRAAASRSPQAQEALCT